ncbi:MAG: hypothetical protein GC185_10785 [Alphaproteobacteria bacterium]|nr:hypothetical protein [Alphaproteobacteria bacterium]
MPDIRQTTHQFVRFCLIGAYCTVINYGVFYLLLETLGEGYYLPASAMGFVAGVAAGYPFNRKFTFKAGEVAATRKALYGMVYVCSLLISLVFLRITVGGLHVDARIANILSIGITTCTNFMGVKWFVFRA